MIIHECLTDERSEPLRVVFVRETSGLLLNVDVAGSRQNPVQL